MKIEVSIGEVFDKISILEIKCDNITDPVKLKFIKEELRSLSKDLSAENIDIPEEMYYELKEVNTKLWETEDVIRRCEKNDLFLIEFITHARLDATLNDERFLIKNKINNYCDSAIKEQKSYEDLYSAD
jgi:DNA-binding ferritin-like protein (Dps family)